MEPVRVGVVGTGSRGSALVRVCLETPEVKLAAIADVKRERVDALADEHEIPAFSSHQELIESGLVEALIVATPHPSHAEITIDAARNGLHVLCEKPIAVKVSEADKMAAAAKKAGIVLGIGLQRRLDPVHRKARAMIQAGELGEIYDVDMISTGWYRPQSYYDSGDWRATWKGEGGGILANQSPHDFDMLNWLGGLPTRVRATICTRIHRIETEDTVHAVLEYGGAKMGSYTATTANPLGRRSLQIAGEKGILLIENGKLMHCRYGTSLSRYILNVADRKVSLPVEWQEIPVKKGVNTSQLLVAQFAKAIRLGEPVTATAEDGIRALELANAMHLSGLRAQPATIPVDRDAIDRLFDDLIEGRLSVPR